MPEERTEPDPPPTPWTTWEEAKQVRETLKEYRLLLLRRPEHLSAVEQALVATPFEQSGCSALRVARDFLLIDWYRLWADENRQRRSLAEAQAGFEVWRVDMTYAAAQESIAGRFGFVGRLGKTQARFAVVNPDLPESAKCAEWHGTDSGPIFGKSAESAAHFRHFGAVSPEQT